VSVRVRAHHVENVANSLITDRVTQVDQGPSNAIVAPGAVLLGQAHDERLELCVNLWATRRTPVLGDIKLLRDELTMPGQDGVRLDDRGDLCQSLLAQPLADLGEGFPLPVSQAYAAGDLVTEKPVLRHQVFVAQQEFFVHRSGGIG
jgi:hypothetical protein